MNSHYARGSQWRRWDLHLHTPGTKKEDQYIGENDIEKWNGFYSTIHKYVDSGIDPQKSICAIAITDYLSIDNYMKVRDDNRLPECVKLVLPNVEIRLTPIAKKSPINAHCIFSPEIADEIEDRFFSKLEFTYKEIKYSACRSQLTKLGHDYSNNKTLSTNEAYKIGLSQYVLSIDTIIKVFKNDPELRENTIILVSNNSSDGASGTRTHSEYFTDGVSQLEATRRSIYQNADMIFSSNPKDVSYFLGKGIDNPDIVKQKCGSLMPCVHGCDAHTNSKIFEPDDKRYCWIKADPTFEGLRQILYEPEDRVKICATYPQTKQEYQIIDHVEIPNNENFDPNPIYFNENLTCIIGGKSTGKSLLLHNIAHSIDEKQVDDKAKISPTNVKNIPQVRVHWRDGACSDSSDEHRKIVYIPQTYLNRLSDEKEETTEVDQIIHDIVIQDEGIFIHFTELKECISLYKQNIAKIIVDFLQLVEKRNTMIGAKKEIGDESGIQKEISRLSTQLEQLSKEYDVTEDEVKAYQGLIEKAHHANTKLSSLVIEKGKIEIIEKVTSKVDLSHYNIKLFADKLDIAVETTQSAAKSTWIETKSQLIVDINEEIENTRRINDENSDSLDKLRPKMEGNEQLKAVSDALAGERKKLEKHQALDQELAKIQNSYDELINTISSSFITFKEFYLKYLDFVNEKFPSTIEDLDFSVNCVFRSEQFSQKALSMINRKTLVRFKDINIEEVSEEDLKPKNLKSLIESIITDSPQTLQLTKGYSKESALRDLFSDWYNIDYTVSMDGDSFEDMSPGKKALILLRLLISLAESKCPILIDQPEDDLDNRSIFDELINFIKAKKNDRQIIVVTHNANIVIGGDAELVIIANQQGKNSPNKNYRFEYRSGSIENNVPQSTIGGDLSNIGLLDKKGIQTHICEILEGGETAFELRKMKYHFAKK